MAKKRKKIQTVAASKKTDSSDAMELDSGDEDLQNFLNNQYFMLRQVPPMPPNPIGVTNDLSVQSCATPAGSLLVHLADGLSSESDESDSDSDSSCSYHSSCQIPGGCNPATIDETMGLCP